MYAKRVGFEVLVLDVGFSDHESVLAEALGEARPAGDLSPGQKAGRTKGEGPVKTT